MAERAANLVDHVLPAVPMRQWVLSLPFRLRYLLAWNHELCREVLAVTAIQRFGSGLNLNIHYHTLALDGVFARDGDDWRFVPAPPPAPRELARLVAAIARRVERLLARHGLPLGEADADARDPLAEDAPALAALCAASVTGRSVLGRAAGGEDAEEHDEREDDGGRAGGGRWAWHGDLLRAARSGRAGRSG